jgi:hypothetical protein
MVHHDVCLHHGLWLLVLRICELHKVHLWDRMSLNLLNNWLLCCLLLHLYLLRVNDGVASVYTIVSTKGGNNLLLYTKLLELRHSVFTIGVLVNSIDARIPVPSHSRSLRWWIEIHLGSNACHAWDS